jgi:hypothetical protein
MLAELIFGIKHVAEFLMDKDPFLIRYIGITGCCFMIILIASIPWKIYKKSEIELLRKKIDILVTNYKIEVTRAIEKRY